VNGTVDWTVPADFEVRGGYFYVAVRKVNNATITVTSTSEFQVLDKPMPMPKPSQSPAHNSAGAISPSMGTAGSTLFAALALLGM
jgi:hypothetical protein